MGKLRDLLERSPTISRIRSKSRTRNSPPLMFAMDSPASSSSSSSSSPDLVRDTPPVEFEPIAIVPERFKGNLNHHRFAGGGGGISGDVQSESGVILGAGLGIQLQPSSGSASGSVLDLPRRSFAIERPGNAGLGDQLQPFSLDRGSQTVRGRSFSANPRSNAVNKLVL